ncbi:uncharacterized protein VTP21DRAFT_5120 [Calcarisporiella thermophila]|uniref:uncharacterized protein n=1 Tax=Calcarisporiella thermophila TaxID=911321 RepID=UPI003744AD38
MNDQIINFDLTSEEIISGARRLIEKAKLVQDQVANLSPEQCTFDTVVKVLAINEDESATDANVFSFLQNVSSDKELRESSVQAQMMLDEFDIESSMREDLYKALQYVKEKAEPLEGEDARLLYKLDQQFKRNGLGLPVEDREKLKELRKRLSDLSIQFSRNMNEDNTTILFTEEQLDGLPKDFLESLPKQGEKYVLTMKYPEYFPVMKFAKNEKTRELMMRANETKCKDNVAILEEAIEIRRKAAKLLGYETHASFVLEPRMAKSVENVFKFLNELREKLTPIGIEELEKLKRLKKEETSTNGLGNNDQINYWDYLYYNRLLLEKEYSVDEEAIKEYFSLEKVTEGMLGIYQRVLGLRFVLMPKERAKTWHPDVVQYEVYDNTESKEFMGHIYLDLHPREGKYSHAACFGIRPGFRRENGERVYPAAAMVANFTKPTPEKPSLLKHESEVVTYFHELGHVMHQICGNTKWSRFHGTRVERDFVEAPSQMLENWCWQHDILRNLSTHYKTGEPVPEELVDNIVKAKHVNAGLFYLRQLFFALYDMHLHTSGDEHIDSSALWHQLGEEVRLIPSMKGTFGQASFGHLMGGYDSAYYSYLYSSVFSSDMFYTKFQKDPMDHVSGLEYRYKILEKGGSRDAIDMLVDFLGREPKQDAFLREIMGKTE